MPTTPLNTPLPSALKLLRRRTSDMPAPPLPGVIATPELPPAKAPLLDNPDLMLTFQYMRFLNQHTMDYIRMADAKAAVLITLLSANLLVLVQRAADAIARLQESWTVFLIVGAIGFATISLAVAVNVIRPRLFRNHHQGHIFWEDIVAHEKSDYAASFPSLTGKDILRELAEHNHNLASSALRKFRWLRIGFYLALLSIVISASLILLTTDPLPR